jgi:DNA-binding MarR family transcriptional regulator
MARSRAVTVSMEQLLRRLRISFNVKILDLKWFVKSFNVEESTIYSMDNSQMRDETDEIVEFWHRENPELDVTAKTLAIRLRRASQHLERAVRSNLAANGVDEFWEIEVLMSLLRAPGHRRRAGELQRESQVTSGAITNRVGRLEQRGWVTRDVDPADRRQVLVSLTSDGLKQANHVVATKNESEKQIFSGMDRAFLERLTGDLRDLLRSMETPAPDGA